MWDEKRWQRVRTVARDLAQVGLFLGGAAFATHEVFWTAHADPQVLILASAMMGVTAIWRA